jgi:chromatin remodeling complex protein RSC6
MAKTSKQILTDEQDVSMKVPKITKSTKSKAKVAEVPSDIPVVETSTLNVELSSVELSSVVATTEEKPKKARAAKKAKEVLIASDLVVSTDSVESNVVPTENVVVEQENDEIVALSTEFSNKLNQVFSALSVLRADYKNLERKYMKELKASQKLNFRKKRKANRAPSGFVKPTKISTELATFLGKPMGFEMARTEVTREINKYIRANNLQDSVNGRKINPNPALAKLLKIAPTDELTYFNLQRFMSPHFQKLNAAPLSEAASLAV